MLALLAQLHRRMHVKWAQSPTKLPANKEHHHVIMQNILCDLSRHPQGRGKLYGLRRIEMRDQQSGPLLHPTPRARRPGNAGSAERHFEPGSDTGAPLERHFEPGSNTGATLEQHFEPGSDTGATLSQIWL